MTKPTYSLIPSFFFRPSFSTTFLSFLMFLLPSSPALHFPFPCVNDLFAGCWQGITDVVSISLTASVDSTDPPAAPPSPTKAAAGVRKPTGVASEVAQFFSAMLFFVLSFLLFLSLQLLLSLQFARVLPFCKTLYWPFNNSSSPSTIRSLARPQQVRPSTAPSNPRRAPGGASTLVLG